MVIVWVSYFFGFLGLVYLRFSLVLSLVWGWFQVLAYGFSVHLFELAGGTMSGASLLLSLNIAGFWACAHGGIRSGIQE